MFTYEPAYAFDGVVDLWFNKHMPEDQKAFIVSIYESFDLEVNEVRKRNAEMLVTNKKKDLVKGRPEVVGLFMTPKDETRDRPVSRMRFNYHKISRTPRRADWLTSHEVGHSLGLDHAFDLPVSDTVMGYPTSYEMNFSSTASELTKRDRDLITGKLYPQQFND